MNERRTVSYSHVPIDRAGTARKDAGWLLDKFNQESSLVYCVSNGRNLLDARHESPRAISIPVNEASALIDAARKPVFLGLREKQACFAIDLSSSDPAVLALPAHGEFVDLRNVGLALDAEEAALLAYARGLVHWNATAQHCGVCGTATYSTQGGHARKCSAPDCGREIFPRTDPAVIMLVEDLSDPDNPKCLLGRNRRFAARMFSTLAGFVDPGETLEETVAREVFEEAGIRVDNVRYQASQPWPFPASIMLGFRATARTTEIHTDLDEIEEAYWFGAREVREFGEWGDGGENRCLPRRDSIARYLVDSWVDEMLGPPNGR